MKDWSTSPDLYELTRAIPARFIKPPPQGKYGHYVPHYIIEQAILATVGPYQWELVEILRGPTSGFVKGEERSFDDVIVGAVYRMTLTIDGQPVSVEEPGECGEAYTASSDGARLKKASSDAFKRCAMRFGVGLHLWCKTPAEYFVNGLLRTDLDTIEEDDVLVTGGVTEEPGADE